MRHKKLLSALCLLLVLLMLPLSGFAETIEEALPASETVTEDTSEETTELTTEGEETPAIDLSDYQVDVVDGVIIINGVPVDKFITNAVVTDVENVWSSGDTVLAEVLGFLFEEIWEEYKFGTFSDIGATILSELSSISSQLSAIQEQISKSTQEIIAEIDYQAMVARYDEIDKYLAAFMSKYFGNDAEAKKYLSVIENIKLGEYGDESGKDKIDQTLHKIYSYYDNSFQGTSPITGFTYPKTYEQNISKDLLEMGKYLLGQGFSTNKSNAFQLYQGICSHVYGFNTETLDAREKTNKNLWLAYEAGYALLMPAINYDKSVHQNQISSKQNVVNVLNEVIQSGTLSDEKVRVLEEKVRTLKHEIEEVHQDAVDADASYIKQINEQKDELLKNKEVSDYTISEEKQAASGQNGVMLNYQTGQYYYSTLLKVDYNYGREDAAYTTTASRLVKADTTCASGVVFHYLRPDLTWESPDEYEVNKEDREMTKKTNYQQVISLNDIQILQSNAVKRKTSLYNQLYACCSVSTDITRSGGTPFKDDGSALYYDGFQWASEEAEEKGCSSPDDRVAFHRSVKVYEKSNPSTVKELQTIYKSWKSGNRSDSDFPLVSNTVETGSMVLLQYAPASQKQLSWSKGSSYGLEILQLLSSDKPEITIDGNKLDASQYIINKTGLSKTVTIKISVLQALSIGQHTLVLSDNNVPTTYVLNINEKQSSDYETNATGDYTVDPDSLLETLRSYEALYPDKVISLDLKVSLLESDIDEDDAKMIQDRYGDDFSIVSANITLNVYGDGELIEDAPDVIADPVKIFFYYPVSELNNPKVVRVHDGVLTELTTTKNADGEGITIDSEENIFLLEAAKFSTYALVMDQSKTAAKTPATGLTQSNSAIFVIIGCILVALVAAIVLIVLKKKRKS